MHSTYEVIAFLLQTTLNHNFQFPQLSEQTTLIDARNHFFTRKIKKPNKKLLELGPRFLVKKRI